MRKEEMLRNEGIHKYDTKENAVRGDEEDFLWKYYKQENSS